MSKQLKGLMSDEVARRLHGVNDLLVVDVIGIDANTTVALRKKLRAKKIELMVIRNSLARRAAEGTALAPAFEGLAGTAAVVWGGEDFISLTKEIAELKKDKTLEKFQTRGGVMEGERLTPEKVAEISKWPNRTQMLSILVGQILAPGAALASQLIGPAGKLASQIEQKSKGEEGAAEAPAS
jgi:ribosomal protein L10